MNKPKVLVHGTVETLQKFFSDAVSRDYQIVALLNDEPKKFSAPKGQKSVEVLESQSLPKFIYELIDAIILTDGDNSLKDFFLEQGIEPRKIILYDVAKGWQSFTLPAKNGAQRAFLCGLEFRIRENAKNFLYNRTARLLQRKRQLRNTAPKKYAELLAKSFQRRTGQPLDFNNPKTFTEKLQWLKIFDATPIKSRLADKYLVRNWIEEKIGAEYLIPLLGVWDNFDDINFDELPDKFVLKCNHGSAMNIIVRDKKKFDVESARRRINAWLATDYAVPCLEPHYTRINRKIIAEKFMANGDLPDLIDYKFVCINGKIIYCQYLTDRSTKLKLNYFDINWKPTTVERSDHPRSEHPEEIPTPKNFELMKKLAVKLAEGFAFVRVDFYEVDGRVYFGEMTFTPGAGNFTYKSEGTDEYLGGLLTLPIATPPPQL